MLEETPKTDLTLINVKDISTGGLRIESEDEFIKGTSFELTIPKIKKLDRAIVKCEVTRSEFNDGNLGMFTKLLVLQNLTNPRCRPHPKALLIKPLKPFI